MIWEIFLPPRMPSVYVLITIVSAMAILGSAKNAKMFWVGSFGLYIFSSTVAVPMAMTGSNDDIKLFTTPGKSASAVVVQRLTVGSTEAMCFNVRAKSGP